MGVKFKQMEVPASYRYTGFFDLLADSLYQHKLANGCTDPYLMNRHARASILAGILSLESAANCLIASLEVSSSFRNELDKLPVLAKIEAYFRFRNIEGFDRGRNEVQKIIELVRARNDFVHPKTTNIKTDVGQMEKEEGLYKLPMSLHGEHYQAVGIPKHAMFWSAENALSALQSIVGFYQHIFTGLMQASVEEIQELLLSRFEIQHVHIMSLFEEFKAEFTGASEFGIDLGFLGVVEE